MDKEKALYLVGGLFLLTVAAGLLLVPTPRDPPPAEPYPSLETAPSEEPPDWPETLQLKEQDPECDEFYTIDDGKFSPMNAETRKSWAKSLEKDEAGKEIREEVTLETYPRLADPDYRARRVEELSGKSEAARERAREWAERTREPMRIETNGVVMVLIDYTKETGPIYRATRNINAGISTATDQVQTEPYNLLGEGIVAGIWDGGDVRSTHQEFNGRVTNIDGVPMHWHATHVAGTMIAGGVDSSAIGMAPSARLDAYDMQNDLPGMTDRAMALPGEEGKIQISNHSYGFLAGWANHFDPVRWYGTWSSGVRESDFFGRYSSYDRDFDQLIYDAPYYLPFMAAGNDRDDDAPTPDTIFLYWDGGWKDKPYDPDTDPFDDGWKEGGYNTVSFGSTAKNIMLIGAVNDAVTGGERDINAAGMTAFSSWGPTDDGRIKPDIVANGFRLTSAHSASNSAYAIASGTSMASPNASGSAILITEHYGNLFTDEYIRSSTLRALIIHTADDLGNPGPDYRFGWGLMNTKAAIDHISRHHSYPGGTHIIEDVITNSDATIEYEIHWDNDSPLRATLAWTDPPGQVMSGLNNTNLTLVNDLDMRIIDPGGSTNFPWVLDPFDFTAYAATGDNFRDNVEQVHMQEPSYSGTYTIRISYKDTLENGFQHYSLVISGSTAPLEIEHTPLEDTIDTENPYPVYAEITPPELVDPDQIELRWNSTGDNNDFDTTGFTPDGNNIFMAEIPPHPLHDEIHYYIHAVSSDGVVTTHPSGAPADLHTFTVTEPIGLTVTRSPSEAGTVNPPYGVNKFAGGTVIDASAELFSEPANGKRERVTGWTGEGSVPVSGSTNAVSFTIEEQSTLDWQWTSQFSLEQSSSVEGIVDTVTWWDENDTAHTVTAPTLITIENTNYRFAEWSVDGIRQEDEIGVSVNPAINISMNAPRNAVAVYFDETQDSDGEGLPDWWQFHYFGGLGNDPDEDVDGDGFTNMEEFLDGTNPLDENSFPEPPVIEHTPLADPQSVPAPWHISATITDNHEVASATLNWKRNDGSWQSTDMLEAKAAGVYTNIIPEPGVAGDVFEYFITASDNAGLDTKSEQHGFEVIYGIMNLTPDVMDSQLLQPGQSTNLVLYLENSGNAAIEWKLAMDEIGFFDDIEEGTNDWTTSGNNNHWHISTNRSWSGDHAWYNGIPGTREYTAHMNAAAQLPPVTLHDDNPVLTFRHWIDAELGFLEGHAFHGGIVTLSHDGGETYHQIEPSGGYPYQLEDFGDGSAPFPAGTPVYSGAPGWQMAEFDLSEFAGDTVLIRFHFGSDSFYSGSEEGWYIDDVHISPDTHDGNWLNISPTQGNLEEGAGINIDVTMDAAEVPSGEDRAAKLFITGNDPTSDGYQLDAHLQVRSPPLVEIVSAEQTSTDGTGRVTINNTVSDPDMDILDLEIEFSSDGGNTWIPAWIGDGNASAGGIDVDNALFPQVSGALTGEDGIPITNHVSLTWNSMEETEPIVLSTDTLIRIRAFDGIFWSEPAISQPFMVDNEPPGPPDSVTSTTHAVQAWSTENRISIEWHAASDGEGAGVAGYGVVFTETSQPDPPEVITHTGTNSISNALADGTNWWAGVRAIDVHGNAGEAEIAGPFMIDATPPSPEHAVIEINTSEYGDYTAGPTLTNTWSGFSDEMSGISGYYFSLENNDGSDNGNFTVDTSAILHNAIPDQTNTVYVWAQDSAGNIGKAAYSEILVLDPDTDSDGSGMTTRQKEVAGLDATDPDQVFKIKGDMDDFERAEAVLRWPYASGRIYTIQWVDTLPYGTNLPWSTITDPDFEVRGNQAVWTDTNSMKNSTGKRFYRIKVKIEQ